MSSILQIRDFVYGKVNEEFILPWLDMLKKYYGVNADYGKRGNNLLLQELYVYAFDNGRLKKSSHRILYHKSEKTNSVSFAIARNMTQRIYWEGDKVILRQILWANEKQLVVDDDEEIVYDEAAWLARSKEETTFIVEIEIAEPVMEPETDAPLEEEVVKAVDEEQTEVQSESNDLVGRKVVHKKFGAGKIQNVDEKYLYVIFYGVERKFHHDAMERGYLILI